MMPLHERLADAREILGSAGIARDEAALDAEVLARHVLDCDRATLLTRARDPLPSAFHPLYDALVARRAAREPLAYIVGHREFWGLEFEVTPAVLIPRPETEFIVEEALAEMPRRNEARRIIDVGTGSGCLAITLATELPAATVVATDISPAALAVARRNAERHGVAPRIAFVQADLLQDVRAQADLIVSNPPYVPEPHAPRLQAEVAQFEPASALFGGTDGMVLIERLLAGAPAHLAAGGRFIFEFGYGQEAEVLEAAANTHWIVERIRGDLQGIPRVAVLRR